MKYLISSLFLFALFACQKDISSPGNNNDHEKRMRFFSGANSTDLSAKLYAIIKDIRVQDSLHNFIPTLVDKIGFPVWEKVATNEGSATLLLGGDEDSAIFMIPFKAANGDIVAYLSCIETSGNILYSLHTRDVILSRINHADSAKRFDMAGFALVLAYFEKAVNNRDSLLLAGCKLPRYRNASLHFTKPTKPTILSEFLSVTICGEVWIPATGEVTGVAPGGSINYGQWGWECRTSTMYVQSVPMDDNSGGMNSTCMAPDGTYYWWCISGGGGGGFLDSRTINGVTYTENDYPGIYDGYEWLWWDDDAWVENNLVLNFDEDGDGYNKLTAEEKKLVKAYPAEAFAISLNVDVASEETKSLFGVNGLNDKSDAFRHAFFNAMNENDCSTIMYRGYSVASLFAVAHESETPPQLEMEKQMDLFNNEVGIGIGKLSSVSSYFKSDSELASEVMDAFSVGKLMYLKPTLPAPFFNDGTPNPNGDPNFYGAGGIPNISTATHGITTATKLTPTNK